MPNSTLEAEQFEKIRTKVYPGSDAAVREVAQIISDLIRQRQSENRRAVLGLATGSTPVQLY
ncbi:MAG TPA: hypothetical protein VE242_02960, partial [Chthoniobacterales bacterium]|nr:hypothetical protein [Chthoniobacterales bacterium]